MRPLLDRFSKNPASLVFLGVLLFQIFIMSRHAASHHLVPSSDDMKFYLDWGTRIARGQWTDGEAFYGLPGYAYWLGALLGLTGRDAVAASLITGVLQSAAFAGVAWLIFMLVRDAVVISGGEFGASRITRSATVVGYLAAGGWALFTPAQAYSVILMPTVGAVLAYWFGVRFLSRTSKETPCWAWPCFGLLIGFTALFIATIFFLLPLAIFAIFAEFHHRLPGRFFRGSVAAALLFVGVLVGISPAWLHNSLAAKDRVLLSAHSGINMWIGNNPVANGYPKIPQGLRSGQEGLLRDSLLIPRQEAGRMLRRSEVSQFWESKARNWMEENPRAWLGLVRTKLVNFWNAFQYDDINVLRLLRSDGVTTGFSSFGIISALGLAGIPLVAWRLPYSRWVIAGVLLHMLALIPVFVTERYRLAAVPGLLICASLSLWLLYNAFATRRWNLIATYVALLASSATFASVPKGDPGAWALSHYNMGVRTLAIAEQARANQNPELASSELARSKRELEIAFAYSPTSTEINLAIGNLWLTNRDRSRAKLFYSRVLSFNSSHSSALNNLGVLALEEKRWPLATHFLTKALESDLSSPKSHYLLARAKLGTGDLQGALAAINRSLALKPSQREFLLLKHEIESRVHE